MKKLFLTLGLSAGLFIALPACGNQQAEADAAAEVEAEVQELDSLSEELEFTAAEIEAKKDSLEAALEALEAPDE